MSDIEAIRDRYLEQIGAAADGGDSAEGGMWSDTLHAASTDCRRERFFFFV